METELVGLKIVGWNLGHNITLFSFLDKNLDGRPGPIEIPNLFCLERKIGDEDLIRVAF